MLHLFFILLVMNFGSATSVDKLQPTPETTEAWTLTFALQPSSARLHQNYHHDFGLKELGQRYLESSIRRREHFLHEEMNKDKLPKEWFHPHTNAIYATLHGTTYDAHPAKVDFDKFRHWSRYERWMRQQLNDSFSSKDQTQVLLQPYWDGNYHSLKLLSSIERNRHRVLQQFDRYQSAPLSQGFGTHYIHLWIGSPVPQRQSVIVDTGSRFTAFPCEGCKNCGQEHHTDPYFKPNLSQSFEALECPFECMGRATCELNDPNGYCYFSQSYTEGSSWTGYQAKDLVYCGGHDLLQAASHVDSNYSIPFVFGCLKGESGLFVTQLADGIMGLSAQENTLPKQLFSFGKIEYNMFALCFRRELGSSKRGVTAGTMTLGGVSSALDTSPMVYARNTQSKGWYTVQVKRIYIAKNGGREFLFNSKKAAVKDIVSIPIDENIINSGKGVIVDSGTTDTYLNANALPAFSKIWRTITGMEYKHNPITLTQEQLQALPTVLVQLQASSSSFDNFPQPVLGQVGMLDPKNRFDVLLAIPATSYMEYIPTQKMYASRLYFTETSGGVLGANAMQGYNILFDWHHHRIGFSQSSCAYDLIEREEQEKYAPGNEDVGNANCKLGRPVLTTQCILSVDMSICEASDNPTNVKVVGIETWTRLVLDPGKDADSCHAVMEDWSLRQNIQMEPSEIKCGRNGQCQEIRPCLVPCMKALKMNSAGIKSSADHISGLSTAKDAKNCSSTTAIWSACDFNCEQTKISGTLNSQGVCVESSRDIRRCHIGACSRLDACLVPYLVQAIVVIEGANINDWDVVENFKTKLLSVSARKKGCRRKNQMIFGAGDINVLSVHPWYKLDSNERQGVEDGGNSRDADGLHADGIQLIIQISIWNPKARKKSLDKLHRGMLREIESQWTNSSTSSGSVIGSNCNAQDMYTLAKDAVHLSTQCLKWPGFETALTKELGTRVRVTSSWTINTQIYDDEINYFGPIGSRWGPYVFGFQLLIEILYKVCFLWISCSCVLNGFEWCCIICRKFQLRRLWQSLILRICKWWTGNNKWPRYEELSQDDEDDFVQITELELTSGDYQSKGNTTPKRRNLSSELN